MSLGTILRPYRIARLIGADAMNIARDPMLLMASGMSLLPALALRLAQPTMDAAAFDAFGVVAISRFVVPLALLIPAVLIGWVTGFLLLEDRDEGVLLAVDVTPVGKGGFLIYRVLVTATLGAAVSLYAWPLILPHVPVIVALGIAAIVALNAVAMAVILPAIAGNKVEGLALSKLLNLFSLVPLLAAVPSPARFLAGILPPYWVGELLGMSEVMPLPAPLTLVLALIVNSLAIVALFRLFARRAG
jgi:fluoroquinolone transport system permease protein